MTAADVCTLFNLQTAGVSSSRGEVCIGAHSQPRALEKPDALSEAFSSRCAAHPTLVRNMLLSTIPIWTLIVGATEPLL